MDKIAQYRQYIKTLLSQYAQDDPITEGIETQLIFDSEHDHYQKATVKSPVFQAGDETERNVQVRGF